MCWEKRGKFEVNWNLVTDEQNHNWLLDCSGAIWCIVRYTFFQCQTMLFIQLNSLKDSRSLGLTGRLA